MRCSEVWRALYDKVKQNSKKRAKIAIVAVMRRLAILMWHSPRSPEINELIQEWTPQQPCLSS